MTKRKKTPNNPMGKPIGTERARELGLISMQKPNTPIGKSMSTARARELSAMRRTFGAGTGAPRSDKLRCACGAMTLKRALARSHNCEETEPRSHKRKEGL